MVRTAEGIASFGFILEQGLSDITFEEFAVPKNFGRFLEPLADLQKAAGIKFPQVVLDADQYDTNEGMELAFRAGIRRRKGKEEAAESIVR